MSHRALYVYYKVNPQQADGLRELVHQLHTRVRQKHPRIVIQLLHREDNDVGGGAPQTWMEVYQHPQGVDEVMQRTMDEAVASLALTSSGQIGPRHTEVFTPCV